MLRLLPFALFACAACSSNRPEAERGGASTGLHALFEREWEQHVRDDPLHATRIGRSEGADRLPSVRPGKLAERADNDAALLAELRSIDVAKLSSADRIAYETFEHMLLGRVADFGYRAWQIPFESDSGFHTAFARLPKEVPLDSLADYENYISRLEAFPVYVAEHIENMRRGMERGMTQPRAILNGFESTMSAHMVVDSRESVFFEPFEDLPADLTEEQREALVVAGRRAIEEAVVPAYRTLYEFFTAEYVAGARETIACSDLPDGRAYYEHLVRHFTTLDVTPEQVHEVGLREVERIRAEMQAIIEAVRFEGNFTAFLHFLRTDPRFYAKSPEALLERASRICKRMDAALPQLFGRLPRQPYGVEPVPEHIAPKYTAGRYVPAAAGSQEPGYYWVNTHALESRPLYALPALSLHEAVPGHHLQHAIAAEQEGVPEFRRFLYITAFGEGWGLYSERLGIEAGLYEDPYDDFGRLTYEMWRACRLVVDTGMHALGWTREQAVDYLSLIHI